ncbi:MAG: hypothetical protein ACOC8E_06715 [Planctomycetota bacterium]
MDRDRPKPEDDRPTEVPLPDEDDGAELEEDLILDALSFCELCGATEADDEEELLRCEECGRLHCSECRQYDEDGTPYCTECYDEIVEE